MIEGICSSLGVKMKDVSLLAAVDLTEHLSQS